VIIPPIVDAAIRRMTCSAISDRESIVFSRRGSQVG